ADLPQPRVPIGGQRCHLCPLVFAGALALLVGLSERAAGLVRDKGEAVRNAWVPMPAASDTEKPAVRRRSNTASARSRPGSLSRIRPNARYTAPGCARD